MRELRTPGSVRGVPGNGYSYRNQSDVAGTRTFPRCRTSH